MRKAKQEGRGREEKVVAKRRVCELEALKSSPSQYRSFFFPRLTRHTP